MRVSGCACHFSPAPFLQAFARLIKTLASRRVAGKVPIQHLDR
jgi:hypothetical protein